MKTIETVEEFWEVIDELRNDKELNWQELVGVNAKLAIEKRLNPTLTNILKLQETLGISILNVVSADFKDWECPTERDPDVPNKMKSIYKMICREDWMDNEETVHRVQEIGKSII